ncbi:MAG TPA: DUF92 domain-containing protein [Candidatus Saccharimonadales bacterium]|nr:DUF92 domain-containing protein [Candidatus Saccharimonadales bacterium]
MIFLQSWQIAIPQLVVAVGLSVAFAFLAWGLRAVTAAAALTGVFLSVVLCLAAGPAALLPIATVFFLTFLTTRAGRRRKERYGTAEGRHGRAASQILANIGVAGICAAPVIFTTHARYILLAGVSAALAEAAGDTVSSELGQAFGRRPLLITTLRQVSPGENGGITIIGTTLAIIAAGVVCVSCVWANLLLLPYFWTAFSAAFFGTLVDSLLGATLERPGRLGNNGVNFTSTAFSAALAIGVLFLHRWF